MKELSFEIVSYSWQITFTWEIEPFFSPCHIHILSASLYFQRDFWFVFFSFNLNKNKRTLTTKRKKKLIEYRLKVIFDWNFLNVMYFFLLFSCLLYACIFHYFEYELSIFLINNCFRKSIVYFVKFSSVRSITCA